MAWGESKDDVYERGRQEGLESDWFEQTIEKYASSYNNTEEEDIRHAGYEEGVREQNR